jgi:hypothetical protein
MKKYGLKILVALIIVNAMGCGNSQQGTHNKSKIDTIANQTLTNKTDMIKQKITPCLWVETKVSIPTMLTSDPAILTTPGMAVHFL